MNNRKRDKNKRARLSLQNRDLVRNQLNLAIMNMGIKQEEEEVKEEDDPLKFFSQQQRKKEKEEEAKKYLHPIAEEDDPLKFFDKNDNEEKELDPFKYLKKENEEESPKVLGNLAKHDEKKLAEAIINNDMPEEITVQKKKERANSSDRKKKMEKRLKTALRLSQANVVRRVNEKLLNRVKNTKNLANAENTIKRSNEASKGGNMLLGEDEQIDPDKNAHNVGQTKEVDLKSFMKNK